MTNLHTIFEILCIQNIWYPNIGYKIYIIYSGDLKIWLIASISNISGANIANKIYQNSLCQQHLSYQHLELYIIVYYIFDSKHKNMNLIIM